VSPSIRSAVLAPRKESRGIAPRYRTCSRGEQAAIDEAEGMNSIEQIIVLAVVQGITEFLPISSSGHLILIPFLTGWPDQGQFTDVMSHLGTLLAVLIYFWRDVWRLILGTLMLFRGKVTDDGRLAL
jgi:undecaprenyl pyrophosphate phosphatase UppP